MHQNGGEHRIYYIYFKGGPCTQYTHILFHGTADEYMYIKNIHINGGVLHILANMVTFFCSGLVTIALKNVTYSFVNYHCTLYK